MRYHFNARLKAAYRRCVPTAIRKSKWVSWPKKAWHALLPHDSVYDDDYYENAVDAAALLSADVMARSVCEEFTPDAVVDVGCGTGALLAAMRRPGVKTLGLEYSSAGIDRCRACGLEVLPFDLERDSLPGEMRFDVAVSVEVAEHLPARVADRYVDLLTRLAGTVVFTAAPPGQGGTDHVNEQRPEYWIEKFEKRSFFLAEEVSSRWKDEWRRNGVAGWYWRNLMVFRGPGPDRPSKEIP